MDEIPKIVDSNETYSKLDGDRRAIVKYLESEERYYCTVLDKDLSYSSSFPVDTNLEDGIIYATVSALNKIGDVEKVEVFAFREDMSPIETSLRFTVDTDLLYTLSQVSTESLRKLVDDGTLDVGLRSVMKMALSERGVDV